LAPKVYIIILHWKNIQCLAECIESLGKVSYDNFEIIIVNNGSNDLINISKSQNLSFHTLTSPSNLGFAAGNNIGIKEALKKQADYLLLLNDDTVVAPEFLDVLINAGENNPDVAMLGPKIYYFNDPKRIWFAGARFDSRICKIIASDADQLDEDKSFSPVMSDYLTGCALLLKRHVIERIGFLDERFFLYWEDVDWGLRASDAGFLNVLIPTSKIWHKASFSSGGSNSPLKAYHQTRSHLLFAEMHAPKTRMKLCVGFFRDILWLLHKSHDPDKLIKSKAYYTAMIDYFIGKTGPGPQWLWKGMQND